MWLSPAKDRHDTLSRRRDVRVQFAWNLRQRADTAFHRASSGARCPAIGVAAL